MNQEETQKLEYAMKLLYVLANKFGPGATFWCKWCENTSESHHEKCALDRFVNQGEMIEFDAITLGGLLK